MGFFDSIRFFGRSRAPEGCWPWPNSDRDPYGVPSPAVQSELLKAACHEAGHAVVCRYFGIEVRQLSIRRVTYTTGSVTTVMTDPERQAWKLARLRKIDGWSRKIAGENNPFSPNRGSEIGLRPRDHFVHEVSLHAGLHDWLAGAVAENIEYGPFTYWEGNGWESDLEGFELLVSAHYGNLDGFISDSSVASIRDRYWKSCEEILSKPEIRLWHQAVVKVVLRSEHGVLSGEEIDALRSPIELPHLVVPDSFDDAREIADRFGCGQVVAIEFVGSEPELERRLVDFSTGICYARDGEIRWVDQGRYLVLPSGRGFDPDEDPDNSPWDPDRSPLGPSGPSLASSAAAALPATAG